MSIQHKDMLYFYKDKTLKFFEVRYKCRAQNHSM